VAVASAGPNLTPDRQQSQHLIAQFFTGRMTFLMPNNRVKALKAKEAAITTASV